MGTVSHLASALSAGQLNPYIDIWHFSSDDNFADQKGDGENSIQRSQMNPLMDSAQNAATAIEYKKGYVMRKCCYDANYKKSLCLIRLSFRLFFWLKMWK